MMSLKFSRQKDRHFLLSLLYKLDKIIPFSKEGKLKFYLDLEWIAERLAHEHSFSVFPEHPVRKKTFSFLQSHLMRNDRVLDVGCGSGALSRQIADHVAHIVAIDHNDELIALARRKFPKANLEFQKADALEFVTRAKEPFHILILSHLLEHLDNPAQFLLNHVSRFKKIHIEVPDLERSPLNEYRREINSKLQYSDNDHIWEFTRDDMRELITSCGLLIEDSEFRYGVQKYWCSLASSKEHIA